MLRTLNTVFRELRYTLAATLVAGSVFVSAVLLPNFSLLVSVFSTHSGTFIQKIAFMFSLLGSITTNFTIVSAVSTILIAVLFGVNVVLLAYYLKKVRVSNGISTLGGVGLVGLMSGFLGIGCAACGTFILSSVLVLVGAGGLLAYLPFGGEEFGFIGIGLLLYSLYATSKKITEPNVCKE